ncbi:uncharacterized protein LOC130670510 [Microplitis mediator]|uniref:uncharacterized protein LOC130670510 n=1 Tax=Microplitis mediator TaxID=375433 RepID=UPI002554F69E|nr:uncharacterized protein LOC130670510 [Microplitis mediator]
MLNLSWAIPFVPIERINNAVSIISDILVAHTQDNPNYERFRIFLTQCLVPQASSVSIRTAPWQAQNLAEDVNEDLLSHFTVLHPSVYDFTKKLSSYIQKCVNNWSRNRRRAHPNDNLCLTARVLCDRFLGGRCTLLNYLTIVGRSRAELRNRLDVSVDRQQYLYDDLSGSVRVDLLHDYRRQENELLIPAEENMQEEPNEPEIIDLNEDDDDEQQQPMEEQEQEQEIEKNLQVPELADDLRFYDNEIELLDDPVKTPWINESTQAMQFNDVVADDDSIPCSICQTNIPKVTFCPCGHKCICLEYEYKLKEQARRENAHRNDYTISCILCRKPCTETIIIH